MKRISIILAALALVLGLSQCKKQEQSSNNEEDIVPITLEVRTNSGSRINVNTANGAVSFETGDVVYVASGNKFVGTLTYNGATFAGNLTNPTTGEPLYFYFLGNKTPEETLTAGTSTYCSVSISDQTSGKLPVISSATSNEIFTGAGLYTAFFLNKAALVKFDVTTPSSTPTSILGMNNKVTVSFADNSFEYSQDDEGAITLASGNGEHWAILLPQGAIVDAVAQSGDGNCTGTCSAIPAIIENDYLTEGIEVTLSSSGFDHAYVDLGLPSGLLWATCNVGADAPEDYGDYFAWGETEPKGNYDWSTYQYCNGIENTFTKYCNNPDYGSNGFTDNLTSLLQEDDAATANWGNGWRMPSQEDWQELINNTTSTWTTQNGVNGRVFTASNGNTLFLPAGGWRTSINLTEVGNFGIYWSSSLFVIYPDISWTCVFNSDDCIMYFYGRSNGQSVRPVRSAE